jgi:hypothetical protein
MLYKINPITSEENRTGFLKEKRLWQGKLCRKIKSLETLYRKVSSEIIKIENSGISGLRTFCGLVGSLYSKPVFLQLA